MNTPTHHAPTWVQTLLAPLNLAAYITWLPITLSAVPWPRLLAADPRAWLGLFALLGMLLLFVLRIFDRPRWLRGHRGQVGNMLLQGALVVLAEALLSGGSVAVLMIIVAVQLVMALPVWRAAAGLAVFNAAIAGLWWWRTGSGTQALLWLTPLLGFQLFAGLTAHYAAASERARAELAAANTDLHATQCLLEETARSGERLKLSRELHDLAGHKLTALKITLRCLARDPHWADHQDLGLMQQLTDELLDDIRGVVSELRQHEGVELAAAFAALARPLPGTRILVEVASDLRADKVATAEVVLRCAMEATTNALRHARPQQIRIRCRQEPGQLALRVSDDGRGASFPLVEGNGLRGMRERLDAVGGSLHIRPLQPHGLELCACIPSTLI